MFSFQIELTIVPTDFTSGRKPAEENKTGGNSTNRP